MGALDIEAKLNSISKEQIKDLQKVISKACRKMVKDQYVKLNITHYRPKLRRFGRTKDKASFATDAFGKRRRYRIEYLNHPTKLFF